MAGSAETAASCAAGTPIAIGNRCHPMIVSSGAQKICAASVFRSVANENGRAQVLVAVREIGFKFTNSATKQS
ncbi:hypothetical protein Mal52_04440 [Symmachiella dynata]|uniref:Uncharacterized protein n=1 Tax=Symmachiella dynata TaxID=2527995 RepID=A0A517ZHS4_9PLAN|nr:hypothetical protein Mal52_04440 [Symmachiella dynata]